MFAYKAQNFKPSKPVDFQDELPSEVEEFFYWRKHPDLHGLMEKIYREKGGKNEEFSGPVQLTAEDLERIGLAVIDGDLPKTSGFFFGESTDENRKRDLEFLTEAKRYLDEGYTIWYDSWW